MNNSEHFMTKSERKTVNILISIIFLMLIGFLGSYVYFDILDKQQVETDENVELVRIDCGLYDANTDTHEFMCYKRQIIISDYYKENLK